MSPEAIIKSTSCRKARTTKFSVTATLPYLEFATLSDTLLTADPIERTKPIQTATLGWSFNSSKTLALSFHRPPTLTLNPTPTASMGTGAHIRTDTIISGPRLHSYIGIIAASLSSFVVICIIVFILGFISRRKRQRRSNSNKIRSARSNSHLSFDNMVFSRGRRFSEYMDLSEAELAREKLKLSLKRKISVFTREDKETRKISGHGARLSIIELPHSSFITDDNVMFTASDV